MLDLRRLRDVNLRQPVVLIVTGALLVVGGLGLIATRAMRSNEVDPHDLTRASHVLQSVRVTLSPSGDLTSVDGHVVGTTTDKKRFTGTESYSPRTAAGDLPVRVLTSYRTAKKTGTDLSDLDGYDGPLQIRLTVQNLTVKARTLTYDVDGHEQTRRALVGAPMTVVASTALDDVGPADVRRTRGAALAATNGVLSQDSEGRTQVQWATVLAPPQLPSNTSLTLSLDAKDFKVPDFDLSVEPGIITDASVGALLDRAFNPAGSEEMQLERRTIDLVEQVNTVLSRAGATIARVRANLDESSKTLGTKTVNDLKSSASSISGSVQELDSSVTSLGKDLTSSLRGTRSTTLEQLRQMVQAVDQMLGNTSAQPPAVDVSGTGCATTVAGTQKADSVYGNLLQVVSQLDGYARSTGSCKEALRLSIVDTVGPAEPDAQACADSTSVTCSLFVAGNGLKAIAAELVTAGEDAVASLHPEAAADAVTAADELATAAQSVADAADAVADAGPAGGDGVDVSPVRQALQQATGAAGDVGGAIAALHQQAVAGQAKAAALGSLSSDLAGRICAMQGAGGLSPADADELRSYLTSTGCPAGTGAGLGGAPGGRAPMDQQISDQNQAWSALASDTESGSGTTAQALSSLGTALSGVDSALTDLASSSQDTNSGLHDLVATLAAKVTDLHTASDEVSEHVGALKVQQDGLSDAVRKAFGDAAQNTQDDADEAVDPQIRKVTARVTTDSAALGEMFDRSAAGLTSASRAITRNGARSIDEQRGKFAAQEHSAGGQISSAIDEGLARVTRGVTGSTRDMTAANTLLAQDLRSVLLDLGTRKVKGSGLLGSMTTGAATANTAAYQLALASRKATAYANVRQGDVAGLLLRQAQTRTAAELEAALPAFRLTLPDSATHRTVYAFQVRGDG
jgi:hypothetical protein